MNPSVLSVFDIERFRMGGVEAFADELSCQLAQPGWESGGRRLSSVGYPINFASLDSARKDL